MNKVLIYIISAFSLFIITSCEDIDYNYKEYLEDVQKYSPAVRNVEVTTELGIINLKWENPESNLIKKIKIVAGEDYEYISENIISEYTFENMPIKGYSISIYTIDKFGNLSVPQCVNAFPGSNNEL